MSRVSTQYIVRMSAYENKSLVYSSRRKYERVKRKGDGGGKKEDREGLRATILMTQLIRSLEQIRWLLKINAKLSKMATKRANGVI